jgi:hypothetical protein
MKTTLISGVLLASFVLFSGCRDREAEARRVREEAEVKARQKAAQKEMEALPKTFATPDYYKKNETGKKAGDASASGGVAK